MVLSYKRLIDYFAAMLVRECRWLDIDDIRNDAWEEAIKASSLWVPNGGRKFSTYLYQRLLWYRLKVLRVHAREMEALRAYHREMSVDNYQEPPTELTSLEFLMEQAQVELDEDGHRVWSLMVDPPEEFHAFVKGRWSECSRVPKDHCLVRNSHFAKYLGIHYKKVDRIVERIETAVCRLFHGH
jgi:hypothetical protein